MTWGWNRTSRMNSEQMWEKVTHSRRWRTAATDFICSKYVPQTNRAECGQSIGFRSVLVDRGYEQWLTGRCRQCRIGHIAL